MSALVRWGVLVIAAAAMVGCSNNDSNDNNGGANGGGGGGAAGGTVQQSNLQDQWESNCVDSDTFGLSESMRLEFSGSAASSVTRYHSNGDCTAEAIRLEQSGTFSRGGERSANVFDIDLAISSAKVTPVTQIGVDILRLANFCGISDWTVGVQRDISSASGGERCIPKLPATIYDIYSIESNQLFFGQGDDKLSPERRPTELNRQRIYTRQ